MIQVHAEKGDAVIFCEAIIHGALPWRGGHDRRMVLYHLRHTVVMARTLDRLRFTYVLRCRCGDR
eukprot:COSAG01_NODE_13312_length_1603_cov_2.196809_2_plen_65_part_00